MPVVDDQERQNTEGTSGSGRSVARAAFQVVGFALSVGLVVWAVRLVLTPENQSQLEKVLHATPAQILTLVALSVASVGVNGVVFWLVLRPVRALRVTDVISVNAIAMLLSYLPFKISVIARFAIHARRDKIPVLVIGAWMGAVGTTILATLGPLTLASVLLKDVNAVWVGASLMGVAVCVGLLVWIAKRYEGARGRDRLAKLPVLGRRVIASHHYGKLHEGFEMLAHTPATFGASVLRVLDVGLFAGRFMGAAWVLGLDLGWSDALLLGSGYFLIGALSPFGAFGSREGGTIGVAAILGLASADDGSNPIATATLFVTAIETAVAFACAGFGVAWLRADKLIRATAREGG